MTPNEPRMYMPNFESRIHMTPNFESRIRMNPNGGGVAVTHDGLASARGSDELQDYQDNETMHSADSSDSGKGKSKKSRKQPRTNVSRRLGCVSR